MCSVVFRIIWERQNCFRFNKNTEDPSLHSEIYQPVASGTWSNLVKSFNSFHDKFSLCFSVKYILLLNFVERTFEWEGVRRRLMEDTHLIKVTPFPLHPTGHPSHNQNACGQCLFYFTIIFNISLVPSPTCHSHPKESGELIDHQL